MDRRVISLNQLADLYLYAAIKLAEEYVEAEMEKDLSPFKNVNKEVFIRERFALVFWIINNFFAKKEGDLVSMIHVLYCQHLGISDDIDLSINEVAFLGSRYKEYSEACPVNVDGSKNSFILLSSVIAKNIFRTEEPILDMGIIFPINIDIFGIIKFLRESIYCKFEAEGSEKV